MRNETSTFASDHERIASFGRCLDELRKQVEAELGDSDIAYMRRVRAASHQLEIGGRGLIHFSFEPIGFSIGVAALWAHKLLEAIEIGHTTLHGTYDRIPGAEALSSGKFRWKTPIDEGAWRNAHNVQHHQYTNITGRDPDVDFGLMRLSDEVAHKTVHALQPLSNLVSWLGFTAAIDVHVTGLIDVYAPGRKADLLKDRSWRGIWSAHRAGLGKLLRYYGREYVFFPLLAGPLFWKTLLGNFLSELGKDLYAGATIYCGHVGARCYPPGTRAKSRAEWYVMQVEASRDFEVPALIGLLCGGLERQIEHHLFPRLPPNRLRRIAPRVRAACEEHGVTYRTGSWPATLRDVLGHLRRFSRPRPEAPRAPLERRLSFRSRARTSAAVPRTAKPRAVQATAR